MKLSFQIETWSVLVLDGLRYDFHSRGAIVVEMVLELCQNKADLYLWIPPYGSVAQSDAVKLSFVGVEEVFVNRARESEGTDELDGVFWIRDVGVEDCQHDVPGVRGLALEMFSGRRIEITFGEGNMSAVHALDSMDDLAPLIRDAAAWSAAVTRTRHLGPGR